MLVKKEAPVQGAFFIKK